MAKTKFKIGVTEDELRRFACSPIKRQVLRAIKNMSNQVKFEIGQIIAARDEKGKFMMLDEKSNTIQKFVVVHKEPHGVIYCKKILQSGKMGVGLVLPCMMDERWQFVEDPDYAEHVILDAEDSYDATEKIKIVKRAKDRMIRANKKIMIDLRKDAEGDKWSTDYLKVWNFVKAFKTGDHFYKLGYNGSELEHYEVVSVTESPLDMTVVNGWGSHKPKDDHLAKAGLTTKFTLKAKPLHSTTNNWRTKLEWDMDGWHSGQIYLKQPQTFSDLADGHAQI